MSNEQKTVAESEAGKSDEEDKVFEGPDWSEEADKLGSSEWFTPDTGTQTIRFLDDGEKQEREYEDEVRDVQVFTIEVAGEELKWSVTRGSTESSLWGQLVKVACDRDGLEGEEVTLIRTGTGNDTQYTVEEAANL